MKTKAILLAVASLSCISSANAEDAAFNGRYIGGALGYNKTTIEAQYDFSPLSLGSYRGEQDINGLDLSIFAGYRHQFSNHIVLGAEIGGVIGNADGDRSAVFTSSDVLSFEKNNELYFSLKPGYAIQDNTLFYLIGGYQRANFNLSWSDGANDTSSDDTFDGFHLGLGSEYKLKDKVSVRAEYKYQDYSNQSYADALVGTEKYEGAESSLRIGLSYIF